MKESSHQILLVLGFLKIANRKASELCYCNKLYDEEFIYEAGRALWEDENTWEYQVDAFV
jgi:hypothetical protein